MNIIAFQKRYLLLNLFLCFSLSKCNDSREENILVYQEEVEGFLRHSDQEMSDNNVDLAMNMKLADEDVTYPSCWKTVQRDDFVNEGMPSGTKIRRIDRCTFSESKKTLGRIVWVVIHGTWAQDWAAFYSSESDESQIYRHIKRTAASYARSRGKELDLVSFKWTGDLSDSARLDAAKALEIYFNNIMILENQDIEIVILCHSHGCNIGNNLTQFLEKPIHMLIYLACPPREEKRYQAKNFQTLIYFYSDDDWIAKIGQLLEYDYDGWTPNLSQLAKMANDDLKWIVGKTIYVLGKTMLLISGTYAAIKMLSSPSWKTKLSAPITFLFSAGPNFPSLWNSITMSTIPTNKLPSRDNHISTGFNTTIENQDTIWKLMYRLPTFFINEQALTTSFLVTIFHLALWTARDDWHEALIAVALPATLLMCFAILIQTPFFWEETKNNISNLIGYPILIHSDIVNVSKIIPEVMQKVHQHHKCSYIQSSIFSLASNATFDRGLLSLAVEGRGNKIPPDSYEYPFIGEKASIQSSSFEPQEECSIATLKEQITNTAEILVKPTRLADIGQGNACVPTSENSCKIINYCD